MLVPGQGLGDRCATMFSPVQKKLEKITTKKLLDSLKLPRAANRSLTYVQHCQVFRQHAPDSLGYRVGLLPCCVVLREVRSTLCSSKGLAAFGTANLFPVCHTLRDARCPFRPGASCGHSPAERSR